MQISAHDFREKRGKRVGRGGCKVDRCQIAKDRLRTRDLSSPAALPRIYIYPFCALFGENVPVEALDRRGFYEWMGFLHKGFSASFMINAVDCFLTYSDTWERTWYTIFSSFSLSVISWKKYSSKAWLILKVIWVIWNYCTSSDFTWKNK